MTQLSMILPVAALCILPLSVVIMLIQARKLTRKMGAIVYSTRRRQSFLQYSILFFTPVLIGLPFIRTLEFFTILASSGVGVLGFIMGFKDVLYSRMGGIYEKGMIWTGSFVFYDTIETYSVSDSSTLVITTQDRSQKTVFLRDSQQFSRMIAKLETVIAPLQ